MHVRIHIRRSQVTEKSGSQSQTSFSKVKKKLQKLLNYIFNCIKSLLNDIQINSQKKNF